MPATGAGFGRAAPRSGDARDMRHHERDDRFKAQVSGINHDRVVSRLKRRHRTRCVVVISSAHVLLHHIKGGGIASLFFQFVVAAPALIPLSASRKNLASACGKTTVPMSRPSATTPPREPRSLWVASKNSLTTGLADTAEAIMEISGVRIRSVMSVWFNRTRNPLAYPAGRG